MTERIGVGITEGTVRAVGVRDGAVRWAAEQERGPGEPLADTIAALLRQSPRRGWWRGRPSVSVALGPASVQTRLLPDLPPVDGDDALQALVQESATAFFLRNGHPLVVTGPEHGSEGPWFSAFDAAALESIRTGCDAAGARLVAIHPAVAVLHRALEGTTLPWSDGEVSATVILTDGRLSSVRRVRRDGTPEPSPSNHSPKDGLASLGDRAVAFADAYAAAEAWRDGAMTAHGSGRRSRGPIPAWRMVVAVTALALAGLSFALAPTLAALRSLRGSEAYLAAVRTEREAAVAAADELDTFTSALVRIETFDETRGRFLAPLASVAAALPTSAAMDRVEISSRGVTVQIVGDTTAAIAALREIPTVTIVSRDDATGAGDLPRTTVRLMFAGTRAVPRAPQDAEGGA